MRVVLLIVLVLLAGCGSAKSGAKKSGKEKAPVTIREFDSTRDALAALPGVEVFPSAANFILLRVPDAAGMFDRLLKRRVLIKNVSKMHPLLANCLRVTVSNPEENAQFLDAFAASMQEAP